MPQPKRHQSCTVWCSISKACLEFQSYRSENVIYAILKLQFTALNSHVKILPLGKISLVLPYSITQTRIVMWVEGNYTEYGLMQLRLWFHYDFKILNSVFSNHILTQNVNQEFIHKTRMFMIFMSINVSLIWLNLIYDFQKHVVIYSEIM